MVVTHILIQNIKSHKHVYNFRNIYIHTHIYIFGIDIYTLLASFHKMFLLEGKCPTAKFQIIPIEQTPQQK